MNGKHGVYANEYSHCCWSFERMRKSIPVDKTRDVIDKDNKTDIIFSLRKGDTSGQFYF